SSKSLGILSISAMSRTTFGTKRSLVRIQSPRLLLFGDLLELADVYPVVSGCRRVYFGTSVSARHLTATMTMVVVAREVGVDTLVNMSQMTVSQMSIQNTTPSPQQRQLAQRAGALGNARCANRMG